MRVLILGGDGYLGWPTAMHLSSHGHDVAVVDNYLRRRICREENVEPLFDVPNLHQRIELWQAVGGRPITVFVGDLCRWSVMAQAVEAFGPDAIVHYAEQPAAPYSMLSREAASLTLRNNLDTTFNLIFAVKRYCPNAQIVKLGTMGEYGTPNIDIEEGWIEIQHNQRKDRFLFPRQASSLYHTTKIMDTDLLWFYVRTWELRVTDLMQGPVYGLFTDENKVDDRLLPFFNYDELFGTVLNRFIVQAVGGHPLTVYGSGGQTRGYINILDTVNCVRLSIEQPAAPGELRIFNQFTETFSVNDLALLVQKVGREIGLKVETKFIDNPRVEAEEHYYRPKHTGLLDLGLEPHLLTKAVIERLMRFTLQHRENIEVGRIFRNVQWQ